MTVRLVDGPTRVPKVHGRVWIPFDGARLRFPDGRGFVYRVDGPDLYCVPEGWQPPEEAS